MDRSLGSISCKVLTGLRLINSLFHFEFFKHPVGIQELLAGMGKLSHTCWDWIQELLQASKL